ncbi:HMG box protein, partial [Colletotrichum graminicola M1.001]
MGHKAFDTPKKARLRGAHEFLEAKGIDYKKKDLFAFFEVSERRGRAILADREGSDRTHHNNQEKRGRKRLIQDANLDTVESLYDTEGFEAKRLPWASLPTEAGIPNASKRTIQRALKRQQISKRIAKQVTHVDKDTAYRRLQHAENALRLRPEPSDWHDQVFSDKCHFSFADKRPAHIAQKPRTRHDPS